MEDKNAGLQRAISSWVNTRNMQPIVDRITPLIWTDINIINAEAIIVASSKIYRIGKYHNAAHMLLDTEEDQLIIEHTNDVPGVLHGVNLPIIIEGIRVGMIGITGVPSEVQFIAKLVQELLQLYISQARKDQEISQTDQLRHAFLFEWLFNHKTSISQDFEDRGRALGIVVNKPWIVCVLSLQDQPAHLDQQFESIQRHAQRLLDDEGRHEQSISIGDLLYILLDEKEAHTAKLRIQNLRQRLTLDCDCIFPAGVSRISNDYSTIQQALKDAKLACRISQRNPNHDVLCYDELDTELVVALVPREERIQLFHRVFGDYTQDELEQTMEMLRIYTDMNGSISQTADILHIHKNSLQYRLNRFAARTGYVPQNIAQMSYLYILLLIYQCDFRDKQKTKEVQP